MFDFGKHVVFIWGSYGAVVIVLVGLVFWLITDGRRQKTKIAALEKRGVSRRADSN